jgi:flagellar hook-length control protein FliK
MVTQTLAFFPVPTAAMGNGAAPSAMGDTADTNAMPFANALTQAQTQTQAGMNPLLLAMLNGMAGLPTTLGDMPIVPNLGDAATAETPIPTETATPGQETTPENANITLLAMAALCLNPVQAAAEPIAPQIPVQIQPPSVQTQPPSVQADIPTVQAAPTTTAIVEQAIPQVTADEMVAFVAQIQAGQTTTASILTPSNEQKSVASAGIPSNGQKSGEEMATPVVVKAAVPTQAEAVTQSPEQKPTNETANSSQPVSPIPAQLLEAQAKLGVNIKAVQGQQAKTVSNISPNPSQQTQADTSKPDTIKVDPNAATLVSAESNALPVTQGTAKKIAALPMDTERAIALPSLTSLSAAKSLSSEAETSEGKGEETADRAIATAEVKAQDKTANPNALSSFGETMHRVENAGQSSAIQTDAVKPQTADRYDVAAQVTKHLETMTTAGGRSEMVLQLKPEHLGQIRITLSKSENGLSAQITMDSAQAHQAMTGAKETLRSAFEQRGINLETLNVSLNQQAFGNGQQAFAGMQMGHSHSQAFGSRHQSATETAFAGDETDIPLVIAGQNTASGLNRLDFRA